MTRVRVISHRKRITLHNGDNGHEWCRLSLSLLRSVSRNVINVCDSVNLVSWKVQRFCKDQKIQAISKPLQHFLYVMEENFTLTSRQSVSYYHHKIFYKVSFFPF